MEAKRIEIKGESGFGLDQFAFKDKLTITPDSIAYVYKPGMPEFDAYRNRRWTYKTKNAKFADLFTKLVEAFEGTAVLDELKAKFDEDLFDDEMFEEEREEGYHDTTECTVIYEDGSQSSRKFELPDDNFAECYEIIKELIPKIEQIPRAISDQECEEEA